jgi:hypothetical protein
MATASRYTTTSKALKNVTGQQGLVYKALANLGSATVEELTAAIAPDVKTVQTPERIAAYYVCVLKKSGHVVAVSADGPTLDELVARRDMLEAQYDEAIAAVEAARAAIAANFDADVAAETIE